MELVWLHTEQNSFKLYVQGCGSTFLCPRNSLTYSRFLVLWYSIVALQCLKVWKVMRISLGFPSFLAARFLDAKNADLMLTRVLLNTRSPFFGNALSILASFRLILNILVVPPFSGSFSVMILRSTSTSIQWTLFASPDLMAVSFSNCRKAAVFCRCLRSMHLSLLRWVWKATSLPSCMMGAPTSLPAFWGEPCKPLWHGSSNNCSCLSVPRLLWRFRDRWEKEKWRERGIHCVSLRHYFNWCW